MKILGISDNEVNILYSPQITERFSEVDLILSCGDLPFFYLEYIITMLNKPFYYVHGNHYYGGDPTAGTRLLPLWEHTNLHRRVIEVKGITLAGVEGSIRYNRGPHQYTQEEMWSHVFHLVPQLLLNKTKTDQYLDVFISHASPWGVHDKDDLPHQGVKAFRWLIRVFKPRLHLHGHIHLLGQDDPRETRINKTHVVNVYGYRIIELLEQTTQRKNKVS